MLNKPVTNLLRDAISNVGESIEIELNTLQWSTTAAKTKCALDPLARYSNILNTIV